MLVDAAAARALTFAPVHHTVDRGRLRFFAAVIGEDAPEARDLDAARARGYPDLPVPPTFLFGIELERPYPFGYLTELGVDLRFVLHGEQSFDYRTLAFAGESLTLTTRVVDVYAKRGGAMEFLVKETEVFRGDTVVAVSRSTVVVLDPAGA